MKYKYLIPLSLWAIWVIPTANVDASSAPPEEAEAAHDEHAEELAEPPRPFTLFVRPIEPTFEDVLVQVKISQEEMHDLWVSEVVVLWAPPTSEAVNVPVPSVEGEIFATKIGGPLEKGEHQLHASITLRDERGLIRKVTEQSSILLVPDMILKEMPFIHFPEEEHHEEGVEDHGASEVEESGGLGLAGIILFIIGVGAGCGAMIVVPRVREKGIGPTIAALKEGLGKVIGLIREKIAKIRSKGTEDEESEPAAEKAEGPVVSEAEKVTKNKEATDDEKVSEAEIEAAITETELAVDEEKTIIGEAEPEAGAEAEEALELNEADLEGLEALEEKATEEAVEAVGEVVDKATEVTEPEEKAEDQAAAEAETELSVEEKEGLAF